MPVFQIDVGMFFQGERWTNVYHCVADNIGNAQLIGNGIGTIHRNVTDDRITLEVIRVRDMVPGTDNFIVTPVNLACNVDNGVNPLLPLFNVVRVDIGTLVGGRPSRKYLRGILVKDDVADTFAIAMARYNTVYDDYASALEEIESLCDESGNGLSGWTVKSAIGMRQLRRGTRRRTEPVIPE